MRKPIAITLGDPAGIGPEICQKLSIERASDDILFVGDARILDLPRIHSIDDFSGGAAILHRPCTSAPQPGKANPENAKNVIAWIEEAAQLAKSQKIAAIVTAPINKNVLISGAAFPFPGHTEFLENIDNCKQAIMMLTCDELSVIPTTIHCALQDVPKLLTPQLLERTIRTAHDSLQKINGIPPRIAVAGLNPHAGENGKIGQEEREWINDLILKLKEDAIQLEGPLPADTMFHPPARAKYDVAVCMYHDQALIPIKTIAFDKGVNVTLGMSFLRTSPDHGTAFDIAGKGLVNPSSMIAAYDYAKKYAVKFND